MRKALTMLVLALVLPAGAALADDDCRVPMADWQPREAVTAPAESVTLMLTEVAPAS